MKKDTDEIIVNLNGDDNAEVRKLTDSEQLQMKKLQRELRKELGLEDEPIVKDIDKNKDEQNKQTSIKENLNQNNNRQTIAEDADKVINLAAKTDKTESQETQLDNNAIASADAVENHVFNNVEISNSKEITKNDQILKDDLSLNTNKDLNTASEKVSTTIDNKSTVLDGSENEMPSENIDDQLTEENTREEYTDNYEQFFKQYSRKDDDDSSSYGKYDSDLDFKLNRKLKKVKLPLQKKYKALIGIMSVVVLICACIGLGLGLYKKPQEILLTNISITQPKLNGTFVVDGKYVNDYISYDNIYIICNYSDGKVKKVLLTKDMVTNLEGPINSSGKFTSAGEVVANINYQGKQLKLKYIVSEKIIDSISIVCTNFAINSTSVDLTNKLKVIVNYKNATSELVDINDCKFMVDVGTIELHPSNGVINVGNKVTGRHTLRVIYKNVFSDVSIYIDQR